MCPVPRPVVLIVDDDGMVRDAAAVMFEQVGAAALQAASAAEALRILAATPAIALLFTDVRMPDMPGLDLAAAARRRRPDLKVVLTSGYYLPQPVPYQLVKKPFGVRDLQRLLAS